MIRGRISIIIDDRSSPERTAIGSLFDERRTRNACDARARADAVTKVIRFGIRARGLQDAQLAWILIPPEIRRSVSARVPSFHSNKPHDFIGI